MPCVCTRDHAKSVKALDSASHGVAVEYYIVHIYVDMPHGVSSISTTVFPRVHRNLKPPPAVSNADTSNSTSVLINVNMLYFEFVLLVSCTTVYLPPNIKVCVLYEVP